MNVTGMSVEFVIETVEVDFQDARLLSSLMKVELVMLSRAYMINLKSCIKNHLTTMWVCFRICDG